MSCPMNVMHGSLDASLLEVESFVYQEESEMPTYILLSTLTPEGRRTLHSDPDRMEQVNQEITDFGCRVVAQYAVLGTYDFVTIVEAADNETVAHLSVDLGSRGTVNVMTLPAISTSELRAKLKGPKQMGRSARA